MVAYMSDEPIPAPVPDQVIREFTFPLRGIIGLIAVAVVALLILGGSLRAETTFSRAATKGDANVFAKASLIGESKTFAAAAHGCDCGQGCPCCKSDKPCSCKKGECTLDAAYNQLRDRAIQEKRGLVVSVGCAERVLPGVLTCRIEDFPGVKAPKVLVCRTVNGTFSRIAEFPESASDQQIMQSCPNGNCPNIAHPVTNAFLGLMAQEIADAIVETKTITTTQAIQNPVTMSGFASGYSVSYGRPRIVGRLLGLPFRGLAALRLARAQRIASRIESRKPVEFVVPAEVVESMKAKPASLPAQPAK